MLIVTSCESEIPFEYRSIEAMHTVQANFSLSDSISVANVFISSTTDVDSTDEPLTISDATVSITTPQGEVIPLHFDGDSLYIATFDDADLTPQQGDYRVDVIIDNNNYYASCELMSPALFEEPIFFWQDVMMGMGVLMMKVSIEDPAGEDNYYRYTFTLPDGSIYQNGVISDSSMDGKLLELYAQFNPDDALGYYTMPDDMAGSLYKLAEGEQLSISIEALDKRAYDYFSTLGLSNSNPICSFEGGCLGYFSVSTITSLEFTFSKEYIVEL